MAGRLAAAVLVLASPGLASCRERPEPLTVTSTQITVLNLTAQDWTDVELWVNRYYRAQLPRLAAGGRFDAPLSRFQGGFGHFLDPARERVRVVTVTARTPDGATVALSWSEP